MPTRPSSWSEENGQDMVEYALLLGLVALTAMGVLNSLNIQTTQIWRAISNSFCSAGLAA